MNIQLAWPDPLNSKKFRAALIAAVVAGIASYFKVDKESILLLMSPFLAFIGMQGIADIGKEKAMVDQDPNNSVEGPTS